MIKKARKYCKVKKNKKHRWIQTSAGKVSIALFVISVILLLFVKWFIDDAVVSNINSLLIGLATNLIGIMVTVSFVQYFLDKQNIEEERKEEARKILRYHKIMTLLIERYTLFFQCVTSTIENRLECARSSDLLRDFSFSDMADMYKLSTVLSVELLRPSIELFYEAEHMLREYMIEMIKNIDFKYNKDIEDILIEFIEKSKGMDVSGVIINNQQILSGNKIQSEVVSQYIREEEQHKWTEKYLQGKLNGNLMTPYVALFFLLKEEGRLINKYQNLIINI